MNWRDAYEQRVTLWRFWHTMTAKAYVSGFARDCERKGRYEEARFYSLMGDYERHKLRDAAPIYVDADMVDLTMAAAEEFEPEPLEEEDLLVPNAFVLLEKPLVLRDLNGKEVSIRALSWSHAVAGPEDEGATVPVVSPAAADGKPGVVITYYAHKDDPDGYGFHELFAEGTDNPLAKYPLTPSHMTAWMFGDEYDASILKGAGAARTTEDGGEAKQEELVEAYAQLWRITQVLLRLMSQRISTVERHDVDRHARKRAQREGLEDEGVVVVTLRRLRQDGEAQERSVDWTHRWIVHGFWRQQWYPSQGRHRRIWINDFVKGPADKELRIKDRAYELVR